LHAGPLDAKRPREGWPLEELREDSGRPSPRRFGADAMAALGASVLGALLVVVMRPPWNAHAKAPAAPVPVVMVTEQPPPEPVTAADPGDAGEAPGEAGLALSPSAAAPPRPPLWRVSSFSSDSNATYVEGVVGKRPLAVALGAAGLPRTEVQRILHAFTGVKNLNHASPKDTFAFAREKPSGRVMAFEYATSPQDVWQAKESGAPGGPGPSPALEASKLELLVEERRKAVGVALGEDLRGSLVAAGLDDDIVDLIDEALDGRAELRPGARVRLIATEERIESQFSRYARLDAIEYTPEGTEAEAQRYYYFHHVSTEGARPKGTGGFFDAKGQQPYHGGWRTPVPMARIASRFNPNRMHPVLHVVMPHNGVDFAAPIGTPIYASAAGVVKSAGDGGPCGNMVQIDHPGGLTSAYCHMSRFAVGLHAGQHVEARQLVGYVGQTGRATGPHLHFAIKRGESYLDPLALKLDGVRVVPTPYREEFTKTRAEMDAALDAILMPAPVATKTDGNKDEKKPEDTVFDDSPGL
jgi:murein DD-endopeptidase MepM/ murein hydrolase activator NlpD